MRLTREQVVALRKQLGVERADALGVVLPPLGRRRHEGMIVISKSIKYGYVRYRYERRRAAYAEFKSRRRYDRLKPHNVERLRTTSPRRLALNALGKRYDRSWSTIAHWLEDDPNKDRQKTIASAIRHVMQRKD